MSGSNQAWVVNEAEVSFEKKKKKINQLKIQKWWYCLLYLVFD